MAVGMQVGLVATAAATALVPLLLLPLPVLSAVWKGHLAVRDILLPQAPVLLAAGVMGGAVALLRGHLPPQLSNLAALAVLVAAGAVLYPLLVFAAMPQRAAHMARQLTAATWRRRLPGGLR
jgi:hypothetical protein